MTLRVVMRSYGGENRKNRPTYYSKDLAIASLIRAVAASPQTQLTYLNDGPIPEHRAQVMRETGDVVSIPDGPIGLRGSYTFGLDLPDRLGWPDEDVVSFVEDDYLVAESACAALHAASESLTEVNYFALGAGRPEPLTDAYQRRVFQIPDRWEPRPDLYAGGVRWINVASTTSTFAARVGTLRADRDIFDQCMKPFRERLLDHETCLLYQGVVPYQRFSQILTGFPGSVPHSLRGVSVSTILIPYRALLNRRAARQKRPHYLYAPAPNLALHMEMDQHGLADLETPEWADEVARVSEWAHQHHPGLRP